MPEIFLELIGDASPWLVPLLVVLAFWGRFNWAALNNPAKRASFDRSVGWLREDSFGRLYLGFLGGLLDRVGDWIGDREHLSQASMAAPQSRGLVQRLFGFNPFTARSYEKCLWLALMYPMLAYLMAWAMGAEGRVGDVSLLNGFRDGVGNALTIGQRWSMLGGIFFFIGAGLWFVLRWAGWKQWLALVGPLLLAAVVANGLGAKQSVVELFVIVVGFFLLIFIPLYIGGWVTGLLVHRSAKQAHQAIYSLAVAIAIAGVVVVVVADAFAFAFAGVFAFAFAGVVAVAFAGAVAGAVAFAGVVAGVFAIAIAFAIAGMAMILLQSLQQAAERKQSLHWFWFIYSLVLITLSAASLRFIAEPDYMLLILLWLLLPLVNAPLDWLSLGFTRGLLQAVRTGNHSGWRTLLWAAADLLLAFIFLFLITAVLVGVTALGNAVAGKTLVDLGCILSNLRNDMSDPNHWWIYFMLLSTLVPTLFHFALAGGAVTLWLPRKWRIRLADGLENDIHKTFGAWLYLTLTPVIGFFLMPLALLASLWWLLTANGGALGKLLLNWAIALAQWADPSMALVCRGG